MGATTHLSRTNVRLGFLIIRQEWLRDAAKLYLKYCLPLYSASTCRTRVVAANATFREFAAVRPVHLGSTATFQTIRGLEVTLLTLVCLSCASNSNSSSYLHPSRL